MDRPTIAIIGAGRLGSTLALALAQRGFAINLCDSDPSALASAADRVGASLASADPIQAARGSEIVMLTLPDDGIKPAAERLAGGQALAKGRVLCHCSGFLSSEVLMANKMLGVAIASFHPLASFPDRLSAWGDYRGKWFGIEGDAPALVRVRELASALECRTAEIKPGQKPLYHAAGVLASNYLVALLGEARALMEESGAGEQSQELVLSLAGSVINNLGSRGIEGSMSGPIVRGDVQTVAGHLEAIRTKHPQSGAVYRALGLILAEMVERREGLGARQEITKMLEGEN